MTDDTRKALPGHAEPIPNALVRRIGEALYGDQWVTPLAAALGVNWRTVQRWKADESRVTPRLAPELLKLIVDRRSDLEDVQRALRRVVDA